MARIRIDPCSRMPLDGDEDARALAELSLRVEEPANRATPAPYVELGMRSTFSFLQGAASPAALVARAAELGYDAVGLADRDGLYGMVRAMEQAQKSGLRLVVGAELTLEEWDDGGSEPTRTKFGERATVTLYVEDHAGYRNLCRLLTESHKRHPKGTPRTGDEGVPRNAFAGIPVERVASNAGGLFAIVHPPFTNDVLGPLHEAFGERASLALTRRLDGADSARLEAARAAYQRYRTPPVALGGVSYAVPEERRVMDVLHCIREGLTLEQAGRALRCNAEGYLRSPAEMARLFAEAPRAVARTRELADACRFDLRGLRYQFPMSLDDGSSPDATLRRRTYEGAARRLGELEPHLQEQLEKELALIQKLNVAPYFLSVEAVVRIARERDILCQGRGSAANSAVCYCLGITAVNPRESNLLFERFLSAERAEPPDIDVDFEHERREEVIQEIYARYGRDRAALASSVISFRGKSALRETGKVFGMTLAEVDRLSALVSWWDKLSELSDARIAEAGFDPQDVRVRQVLASARAIVGFPRHLSQHPGGFVLSAEPLENVAPVEPATMKDRSVIPWDKDDLDTLGFFKIDILGLGMLTAIRRCLRFVQEDERVRASSFIESMARVPSEDPAVYDALCKADTVGVFQIESRAQMAMLPRMKPRKFYDLVIEVAIVRPGPIQGGLIHPYLRRRAGEEPIDSPHPKLDKILSRTLGVPLFQEQVMQIAIEGADYTGGEADRLRRDMAAWRRNGNLEQHKERLAAGFRRNGISDEFSERLYKQIHGFAEYGFPESHAASFALLVYASSWLKLHHPAAFAAALVNSQPMGFYSPSTILQDAQRHGVEVRPPCIHMSAWDCTLEGAEASLPALRVGLRQVKSLREDAGRRIEAARHDRLFENIEDLAARASLNRKELQVLAEAGALEPLAPGRREALWKVFAPRSTDLFEGKDLGDPAVRLPPMTRAQQLSLDYTRTGLSVGDHPMKLLRSHLPKGTVSALELAKRTHGARVRTAGLVICRQRPQTASGVVFITMEDEHGFINLVLWAKVFEAFRHVATTSSLLIVTGKIERAEEGAVLYVVAESFERLSFRSGEQEVPSMSRDFH